MVNDITIGEVGIFQHLIQAANNTISKNWKQWVSQKDLKTCKPCATMHGKILPMRQLLSAKPPLHPFCRCQIRPLSAIAAGQATMQGTNGADYWLKNHGRLPNNYITKREAIVLGWKPQAGNLASAAPGKAIGGDLYFNDDGHLPHVPGRIWYEADINYSEGYRSPERILYSNDGLVFVTYDHYESFVEVI